MTSLTRPARRLGSLAVLAIMLVSACAQPNQTSTQLSGQPSSASPKLAATQVLRFGSTSADLDFGFDPPTASAISLELNREIYSFLVRNDRNATVAEAVVPDLAESWERSADGLTWTFKLRKGVQFQKDYGELTADDVVFSLQRLSQKGSIYATQVAGWTSITAIDPYTVKIATAKPDPYMLPKLSDLGVVFAAIVSKKAVTELADKYRSNPVGTGPFQLKEYRPKDRVIFIRNPTYYGPKPILDGFEWVFLLDQNARSIALQNGDIDGGDFSGDAKLITDLVAKGFKRVDGPAFVDYFYLRVDKKPFGDPKVRQAIAYAINFKALNDFYAPLFKYEPPLRVWQPNFSAYDAVRGKVPEYSYDPAKAKQLLAEAGYPNGFALPMKMASAQPHADIMTIVQRDLKAVGIDLQLQILDYGAYAQSVLSGESTVAWQIAQGRVSPLELAQQFFYGPSAPQTGKTIYNWSYYNNQQVNAWIEQASRELDQAKRDALFAQIHEQIMKDLPVIPLVWGTSFISMFSPRVELGYTHHNVDARSPFVSPLTRILEVAK